MKTKFKDVAHFYIGCKGYLENRMYLGTPKNGETLTTETLNAIRFDGRKFTPILKPITDITEDDFAEFCEVELVGENEKLLLEYSDKYIWRACSCSIDEYPISLNVSPLIDEIQESDSGNVLMLHRPSMNISEGWLTDGETYSDCDLNTTARWIAFLCSRGYNVFGLDESEIITKQ